MSQHAQHGRAHEGQRDQRIEAIDTHSETHRHDEGQMVETDDGVTDAGEEALGKGVRHGTIHHVMGMGRQRKREQRGGGQGKTANGHDFLLALPRGLACDRMGGGVAGRSPGSRFKAPPRLPGPAPSGLPQTQPAHAPIRVCWGSTHRRQLRGQPRHWARPAPHSLFIPCGNRRLPDLAAGGCAATELTHYCRAFATSAEVERPATRSTSTSRPPLAVTTSAPTTSSGR